MKGALSFASDLGPDETALELVISHTLVLNWIVYGTISRWPDLSCTFSRIEAELRMEGIEFASAVHTVENQYGKIIDSKTMIPDRRPGYMGNGGFYFLTIQNDTLGPFKEFTVHSFQELKFVQIRDDYMNLVTWHFVAKNKAQVF